MHNKYGASNSSLFTDTHTNVHHLHAHRVGQHEEYLPGPKETLGAFPTENGTAHLKTATLLPLTIQPGLLGNGTINVFRTHDWALARAGGTLSALSWLSSTHLNMAVTSGPRAKGVGVSLGQANSKLASACAQGFNALVAKSFRMDCAQKQTSSHGLPTSQDTLLVMGRPGKRVWVAYGTMTT